MPLGLGSSDLDPPDYFLYKSHVRFCHVEQGQIIQAKVSCFIILFECLIIY